MQCLVRAPGLAANAINDALWRDRTIVKTWLMRGTLHLIAAEDLPVWTAASATREMWNKPYWQKAFGVSAREVETTLEYVQEALDGRVVTREAIADYALERGASKRVDELLRAGWGSILKIVAGRGGLCFGPNEGRNVTFTRPQHWLKEWREVHPHDALVEVLRRYLASHGPATREEFARWWGFPPPRANEVLETLAPELTVLDRDGEKTYLLTGDLDTLDTTPSDTEVRALGMFDAYTLAGLPHDAIVPKAHKTKVYRTGAWVSNVILRRGVVVGTWTFDRKSAGSRVEVALFRKRSLSKAELSHGLERLSARFGEVDELKIA